tara:strand:+ start:1770 stop:2000 length:231 start_codon:yes stop_codon:yes gene_type:complete
VTDKQKYIALFAGFAIIFMVMFALAPKRMSQEEYYQQVPKSTTLKDFYLVYKLWFDEEWRSVGDQALENGKLHEDK